MAPPFHLQVVTLVLRPHSSVAALPHIGTLISTSLGPSSCLSLREACTFGSIQLLDWIWDSSWTSSQDRNHGWSLCNYLRSEPLYHQLQFREGLQVAAARGDVAMVKWFFDHFSGYEVPSEVVTAAAGKGHLPVLEFLLEHDAGRDCEHEEKTVELEGDDWIDSVPVMPEGWSGPGNTVRWGGHATLGAVRGKHFEIVRWLDEHIPHENDQEEVAEIIGIAANRGSIDFAESLLPDGEDLVDYMDNFAKTDAIQWLLDNDFVRENEYASAGAILTLSREGNLNMMKQVAKLHSRKQMSKEWIEKWSWGLSDACERGDLPMVKWMAAHRSGREILRRMKDDFVFSICTDVLQRAALGGQIAVLEYLFQHGWTDEDGATLVNAARGGKLDCVKWLLDRASTTSFRNNSMDSAVVAAAENDHLDILQFFHDLNTPAVRNETRSKRRKVEQKAKWWSRSRSAMDKAAANGHLEVLKWIHANHYDGCTVDAMMDAAKNGHLEVVKWLHANTTAGSMPHAMDVAAYRGHLDVCKWLHANKSEGCTVDAVRYAIGNGHLRVAHWLSLHYPQFVPEYNRLWRYHCNTFDMLLLLQVNYPILFTQEFGRGTKSDLQNFNERNGDFLIANWLEENYPGAPTEERRPMSWPLL